MSQPQLDPVHILFVDGRDAEYLMEPSERDRLVSEFTKFQRDRHVSGGAKMRTGEYVAQRMLPSGFPAPCKLGVVFETVSFIG